jgi:hypothetical protein
MADAFGTLQIPLVTPATGESAGDPFLQITASFFAAVLNGNVSTAWQAVYKDVAAAKVVKSFFDDDPRDATFNVTSLPALFFWREDVKEPVWIAEDYLTQESLCRLLWVFPASVPEKRTMRSSIINGIARTLTIMVERDRDPSWVVTGDTDPQAATQGSRLSRWAGIFEMYLGTWKPYDLLIPMMDRVSKPMTFDAVTIGVRVVERLNYDLTRFDASGGMTLTIKTPDGGVGDGGVQTEQTTLP